MFTLLTLTLAVVAVTSARPSFIAVPADQIAFIDLNSLRRAPRSANGPAPPPAPVQAIPQRRVYEQEQYQPISINLPRSQKFYPQQPNTLISIPTLDTTSLPQRVVTLQQQPQAQTVQPQQLKPSPRPARYERPPDFGEYVDFGAHTGDAGAFGWYSDYPISPEHHSDDSYGDGH